jgi:hypothetical protein
MRVSTMFVACLVLVSCMGVAIAAEHTDSDTPRQTVDAQFLVSRIGDPPDAFLDMFGAKGSPDRPSSHKLTAEERAAVSKAFAALTPLQQEILQKHLASISFADGMPNNALTYPAKGRPGFFNITVRAGVLHETVSQVLNKKENTCFADEDPGSRVVIDAGQLPAFTYILLHESTHVVDGSIGLVANNAKKLGHDKPVGDLTDGVWADWNKPVAAYDSPELQVGCYHRGGKAFTISDAPSVYRALAATPFPSLYATASAHEYVAELTAFSMLSQRLHQPYTITVYLHDVPVYTLEPMKGSLVKSQIPKTRMFYSSADELLSALSSHT